MSRLITSISDIVTTLLPHMGDRPVIRYDDGTGYVDVGGDEYRRNLLRGIALLGTDGPPLVVATLVRNRPEWDLLALASLYGGHTLFPLDAATPDDELAHLLEVSPPDVILVSHATQARVTFLLGSRERMPKLVLADLYATHDDLATDTAAVPDAVLRLSTVPPLAALPAPAPRLADAGTVLGHYATSGTTSLPKVVRITHGNIVAQVNEGIEVMTLRDSEDILNLGPYTHIATLLEFLVTKARGYTVSYFTREPDEPGVLEAEIRKLRRRGVRIRAVMAVPKFWIFLMKEVLDEMRGKPVWRGIYAQLTGIERHAQLHDLGTLDKAKLNAIRIFLRQRMGGHFTFGISSSSRIDPGVIAIFAKLGVTIVDIYGATEASGIIARNELNDARPGSCGRMIDGLEYRIANPRSLPGQCRPVGDLELRGPTLACGYVGDAAGLHVSADGWYRTGDIAAVDSGGWVYLVGRAQELVWWSDGSPIDRMHLSNLLVRSIWVKDALVTRLGASSSLSVFILPDRERLERDPEYRADLVAGMSEDEALRRRLVQAVDWAQTVAEISAPLDKARIYLLSRPLERTPTHKIRFGRELERLDLNNWI